MDESLIDFNYLQNPSASPGINSILFLLSSKSLISSTEAIFSRFTMTSMTGAWYQPATPYEVIFIGLVVLEIFVLRYFQILPLSLTDWFSTGHLIGRKRRKRQILTSHQYQLPHLNSIDDDNSDNNQLLLLKTQYEAMFKILRKLDQQDCLLSSICLLESLRYTKNPNNHQSKLKYEFLPKPIKWILSSLRKSGESRKKYEFVNNETIPDRPIISVFEEAVEHGKKSARASKKSIIHHHFHSKDHNNNNNNINDTLFIQCTENESSAGIVDNRDDDDDDDGDNGDFNFNDWIIKNNNYNNNGSQTIPPTKCQRRYSLCPLSTRDILSYFESILVLFNSSLPNINTI